MAYFEDEANVSLQWNPLGMIFYSKHELYSMLWHDRVDVSNCRMCSGSYGGPIAVIPETSLVSNSPSTNPIITFYSASGQQQGLAKWEGNHFVTFGWSNTEDLLCISDDGVVYVYDLFGSYKRQFSLGMDIKKLRIFECIIFNSHFGTGICILTSDYQFFIINNILDIKLKLLQCPFPLDMPPSCWTVLTLPDAQTSTVLMSYDKQVYDLDVFQARTKDLRLSVSVGSFTAIAVSFNQKLVALLADNGLLWIGSSDFQHVYCEFSTHHQTKPKQLAWSGSAAVICYWSNYLTLVGASKDTIKYYLDSPVHLVPEVDGVRIISRDTHELLRKVPDKQEDVCKLGSMKPGAMLLDASIKYELKSVSIDDNMCVVKQHLQEAVHECISAAGHAYDVRLQLKLIKAASFGKKFLQDMKPQAFVDMCRTLRVLNSIRDFRVGIPLTYEQLQKLTLPVLIDRLVLRRYYYLAIKICEYLRIPKREGASRVLAHWACYKVQQDNDDDELAREIHAKLGDSPGVSYSEIASNAVDRGRKSLAIKLLDHEPKAADQVPLLIRIGMDELALNKAVQSGDSDLVHAVLNHMKKTHDHGQFLMKIRQCPLALSLVIKDSKLQNRDLLVNIFYQEDQFRNSGNVYVLESYTEKVLGDRIKQLDKAKESYDYRGASVFTFGVQAVEEQIKLLEYQSRLEDHFAKRYLDMSVNETLHELLYQGHFRQAEQLRKDFTIPETRFWWIKTESLGLARNYAELEKLAKSKKSPIGYEPFVDVCIKQNNPIEAEKYILRVPVEKRVKLFVAIRRFLQAAEIAHQTRNLDDMNYVISKCTNKQELEKIQFLSAQLTTKR